MENRLTITGGSWLSIWKFCRKKNIKNKIVFFLKNTFGLSTYFLITPSYLIISDINILLIIVYTFI